MDKVRHKYSMNSELTPSTIARGMAFALVILLLVQLTATFGAPTPLTDNYFWPGGFQSSFTVRASQRLGGWKAHLQFDTPVESLQVWKGSVYSVLNAGLEFVIQNKSTDGLLTAGEDLIVEVQGYTRSNTDKPQGTYYIEGSDGTSLPTSSVQEGLMTRYDYREALRLSVLFYDAQRSGKMPLNNPIPWREDSHVNDSDNGHDLSGGWYDAGDQIKFSLPLAETVTALALGFLRFYEGYESAGQTQPMCDMIEWPLVYMLETWLPDTKTLYVQTEINGSGQRLGCRMMVHRLLNKHGISIGRDRVLQLLHIFDPEGVSLRRRNCLTRRQYHNAGPNFLVHIDGYDKLKNYGLAIHGAICGFSRKVLWLKVNRTNNDPDVVASYYIDFIRGLSGVPRCIRTDAGTENVTIINMQKALRWYHDDEQSGEKSVIVGSSHSNQRIEAWWRHLRQLCTGFWIDFFKDLDEQGLLSTAEPLHLECLRFCFTKILQQELDQVRTEWNSHRVRSSAESTTDGKPDLLYFYPELFGSKSYVYDVEPSDIDHLQLYTTKPGEYGCQDESAFHFLDLMRQNHKEMPSSSEEALAMYRWLMNNV